jgi:hypothetical protein
MTLTVICGEKFIDDQLIRIQQTAKTSPPAIEEVEFENVRPTSGKNVDRELLHELMKRGISEKTSLELLRNLRPDQQVRAEFATTAPFLTFSEFEGKKQKMEERPTKSALLPAHPIQPEFRS